MAKRYMSKEEQGRRLAEQRANLIRLSGETQGATKETYLELLDRRYGDDVIDLALDRMMKDLGA